MENNWIEEIVNRAVELVFQRLMTSAPRRKILMVFTGAGSGYVVGRDAIRLLVDSGHLLKVVLSSAAGFLIGEENIRKAGAQDIIRSDQWVWTPTLVQENDLILVPTLSMNTAAKLALGLMDTLANTIILGGLLAGKPVIAIADGADPFGDGGRVFGGNTATAPLLREQYSQNLFTLKALGIHLVTKESFLSAVISCLLNAIPSTGTDQAKSPTSNQGTHPAALSGLWITAGELSGFRRGQTVQIPRGAFLTPLARETARQLELILVEG